jgi:hypothetical protein
LLVALWPARSVIAQQQPAQTSKIAPADTTRPAAVDSLRRRFDQEKFIVGLKAYTKRKTIMGKAASALFNFTERREEQVGLDVALLDRQYDRHNYKIVRNVEVKTLDAFGYSINDTTRVPRNFLEKGGNALHIKTARRKIRKLLLFKPGEELLPQQLAETERLLRQTNFILDARVVVNEKTSNTDTVDIKVLTKDVFSISGGFQFRDVAAGVVTLRDKNFLARGHDFRNRFTYGRPDPQGWTYQGSYTIPLRNYLTAQARYRNEYQFEEKGVSLSRGFVSVNTRYAYSIGLSQYNQGFQRPDTLVNDKPLFDPANSTVMDAWVGRAFQPVSYDLGYNNPARIITAARLLRVNYNRRPDATFRDYTLAMGSLGYSVRHYYKDRYLFGFGRTEDVPTGTLLTLSGGYDIKNNGHRGYAGARIAAAGFRPQKGYLYMSGEFGSFIRQGRWDKGAINTEILAFTRLYHTGNWQWRHFFWNRSLLGVDRAVDDVPLAIENERGIRGFKPETLLRGGSRFVLNYEANVFTPVSFLGFRLAGLAFVDAAWLSTSGDKWPFKETPYTGFGVGLRFRNEYTVVKTIQILIGYYPRGVGDGQNIRLFQSSRNYYTFSDFSFGQPGIVNYQ